MGASCAGSTYEQVVDWRSVGEPVIEKTPPDCIVCLPPHHFAEGNTVSIEVKYSLLLLPSHPFAEARTLSSYSKQWLLCYVVICLKEGENGDVLSGHSAGLTSGTFHS